MKNMFVLNGYYLASQKFQGNSVQILVCTTQHGLLGYDTLLPLKRLYIFRITVQVVATIYLKLQ